MPDRLPNFTALLRRRPDAYAAIGGSAAYPEIFGITRFYSSPYGTLVVAELGGLPSGGGACSSRIFALHIHDGDACSGNDTDPFAGAGRHYNPRGCPHPYHAGDLPPLFSAVGGFAFSASLSERFTVGEIIGKTIVVHSSPDDFTTQPAGKSGIKIACGEILSLGGRRR